MPAFPPPAQDPKPPFGRTRHPFFMHEMVRRQVVAVRATLGAAPEDAARIPAPPAGGRVLFVGIGTSYHAALGGAEMARALGAGRFSAEALTSFDVLEAPERLEGASNAVVYSAEGETAVTNAALELLRARGVRTALLTATEASTASRLAEHRIVSRYASEASWTHTVSYTTALASSLSLLNAWTPSMVPRPSEDASIEEALTQALALENRAVELVERLTPVRTILILGSGASLVTAREAALKFREATGRFAATGSVEELLHGMIPSVGPDTAVLAVTASPIACRRAREGLAAVARVGAIPLLVDSSGSAQGAEEWALLAQPPHLAPIAQVAPFQLLAYWLAVSDGRNPDVMGLDDPRYLEARRSFGI